MLLRGTNSENTFEIRHFHLFAGLGGGARGIQRGSARVGNMTARYRCLGGIDNDPLAIADFERLVGVPGTVMDLFTREQYQAWHGHAPPSDWREATPADVFRAAGSEFPNLVFTSSPCKGLSGLTSEATARTSKYQALNELTVRGIYLTLEAFRDNPPEFVIFENVPRINSRGRPLLDQIISLLRSFGYATAETTHCCGELGGLAQRRKRFLLVARHREKVPPFLYEPPKRRLRGVGEILEKLPLPGDTVNGGPMHRVPALQWATWVRLALIEAGSDWRSLNRLKVENGVLADYGLVPVGYSRNGNLGVTGWEDPSGTVCAGSHATRSGATAVADPRINGHQKSVQMGVRPWSEPATTVTGNSAPGAGAKCVADPRLAKVLRDQTLGVVPWDHSTGTVQGKNGVTNGAFAVSDPRSSTLFSGKGKYNVVPYDRAANTVIASSGTGNGAFAVSDPRPNDWKAYGQLGVTCWNRHSGTVTSQRSPGQGHFSVADPRTGYPSSTHSNIFRVVATQDAAPTVTGACHVTGGAPCVADDRGISDTLSIPGDVRHDGPAKFNNTYRVVSTRDAAPAVTGGASPSSGGLCYADPRAVGFDADADISEAGFSLPQPTDKLVARIISLDGTWHRPFTTLELASLQSLIDPDEITTFAGESDTRWREAIGNAVPSDSAKAIADVMAQTLLLARMGETFQLSNQPIWVSGIAIALSVDDRQFATDLDMV